MAANRPRSEKIQFDNDEGIALSARLDLPPLSSGGGVPRAWAVFAHCFTCSKDFPAASRISRGLAERGFGVLRFDFTGLGSSDGDFANTNFSSNVDDLVRAAEFLSKEHGAPQLLVGHSLGGAAVLAAARRLDSVEAVVTIGAPSDPRHVAKNFDAKTEEIERTGAAEVSLAGRTFTIKKQFLDDLEAHRLGGQLGDLSAALLVMHGPLDAQVPIEEARKIYDAARGYRSFVTLADADHLLSKRDDADYAADVIAAWAGRYVEMTSAASSVPRPGPGRVVVDEVARPFTNHVITSQHEIIADEPAKIGGADAGPAPFELLLASLGACTSMTVRMYADRKDWPLEHVRVTLGHSRREDRGPDGKKSFVEEFERLLEFEGDLSEEQRTHLVEIAGRCPVHRALENEKEIVTREV